MLTNDHEGSDKEEKENSTETNSFKKKLVDWLKSNNLKLPPIANDFCVNSEIFETNETADVGLFNMGQFSSPWNLYAGTVNG